MQFDEAMNKVVQKGQMDIIVQYWNESDNKVQTRYLTSTFLGHATAKDLLQHLKVIYSLTIFSSGNLTFFRMESLVSTRAKYYKSEWMGHQSIINFSMISSRNFNATRQSPHCWTLEHVDFKLFMAPFKLDTKPPTGISVEFWARFIICSKIVQLVGRTLLKLQVRLMVYLLHSLHTFSF